MVFPAEAVQLTDTPPFYEVRAESGNTTRRGFCPTCGSSVVGATTGLPNAMTISAGSLDDPSVFKPQFVCYTSRGHAWDRIDPAVPSFPKMLPMPSDAEQPAG
jgi:hypothetical protein